RGGGGRRRSTRMGRLQRGGGGGRRRGGGRGLRLVGADGRHRRDFGRANHALQRAGQFGAGGVASLRLFGQAAQNDVFQCLRQIRAHLARRRRRNEDVL